MPSQTQIRCSVTSVHNTTVRRPGARTLSLAAADAPVAKTLRMRSAGRRSRSAARTGTSLAAARCIHEVRQPAPGAKVRKMQPVVDTGNSDKAAEQPLAHRPAPRAEQRHAVKTAGTPPRSLQQAGAATHHHLVSQAQRPGQEHCVLHPVTPVSTPGATLFDTRAQARSKQARAGGYSRPRPKHGPERFW